MATLAADPQVERVVICTPDKDLAQCVGGKVVQFDRRAAQFRDSDAVLEKYGVSPASIPDWLALVGDSADGFPGLPGWGAKTAAAVTITESAVRRSRSVEVMHPRAVSAVEVISTHVVTGGVSPAMTDPAVLRHGA